MTYIISHHHRVPPTTTALQHMGQITLNSHFPELTAASLRDTNMQMLFPFWGPQEAHKTPGRGKHRACSPTVAHLHELWAPSPGLARRAEISVAASAANPRSGFYPARGADLLATLAMSDAQAMQHQRPASHLMGLRGFLRLQFHRPCRFEKFDGCHVST